MPTKTEGNACPAIPLAIILSVLYLMLVLRFGWIGDDAAITFRVVDNFLHGYGLRWNVGERVQAYSHPLWMMLLVPVHWLVGEAFLSSIIFSALLSFAAFLVMTLALADSAAIVALCGGLWMLSISVIDYSTSGLENCLEYLLIVLFVLAYSKEDLKRGNVRLMLLGGLIGLTRLDLILIVLPAMVSRVKFTRASFWSVSIGLAPLFLWEVFSLVYYGFPFPNTAYAKLGGGISKPEMWFQGILYLIHHLWADPITLVVLCSGLILPLVQRQRENYALVFGLALYLLYIISIGGDFMSGRMLAVPAVLAITIISQLRLAALTPLTSIAVVFAAVLFSTKSGWDSGVVRNGGRPDWLPFNGVIDERGYYFQGTGLVNLHREKEFPVHGHRAAGYGIRYSPNPVVVLGTVGIQGYFAGPDRHIVDSFGLADPLIARIPAFSNPYWRVGHMQRTIPAGYIESLVSHENKIVDPGLKDYYERLSLIIRGDIFSWQRFLDILAMNLGRFDALIDGDSYRYPELITVPLERLAMNWPDGTSWNAPGTIILRNKTRLRVVIDPARDVNVLHVSVDHNDVYTVKFYRGDEVVRTERLVARQVFPAGLKPCSIPVSLPGITSIQITSVSENDDGAVGSLTIE